MSIFHQRPLPLLPIEHRTLNVQHRIMYSALREPQGLTTGSNDQFKKRLSNTRRKRLRCTSEATLRNYAVRLF